MHAVNAAKVLFVHPSRWDGMSSYVLLSSFLRLLHLKSFRKTSSHHTDDLHMFPIVNVLEVSRLFNEQLCFIVSCAPAYVKLSNAY